MKFKILLICILFLHSCTDSNDKKAGIDKEIREIENGLTESIIIENDSAKNYSIEERMEYWNVPGISIAIVRNEKLRWAKGYGKANIQKGTKVDVNTFFQAGSISKPISALAILKMTEDGSVNLETNVNSYLKNWKIEDNKFTQDKKVTLEKLLSHTAGTNVWGFDGYEQSDTFLSTIEVLNGVGNSPKVIVDTIPGSIWRYSGGGYTIIQKVIEDVNGVSFENFLQDNVLNPLLMNRSTFEQPLAKEYQSNASAAYDSEGKLIEGLWKNYPEKAAAGLWTTPTDLAKYCIEIQKILSGKTDGILEKSTVDLMLTEHKNNWGLGPSVSGKSDSLVFRHDGKTDGFTNEMIAFAHKGNAVIVMTNADNGGKLFEEILRSISDYYKMDLPIEKSRIVRKENLTENQLKGFTGKYKYIKKVPEIGDYFLTAEIEKHQLRIRDTNNNSEYLMMALVDSTFLDFKTGLEIKIKRDNGKLGFKIGETGAQFYRVEK